MVIALTMVEIEETTDTAEDAPKEFTVAVEHAPNECLAYKEYTAEELLDLLGVREAYIDSVDFSGQGRDRYGR